MEQIRQKWAKLKREMWRKQTMQLKRVPLKNNDHPMATRGVCMSLSCACCFHMQLKRAPLKKQQPPDGNALCVHVAIICMLFSYAT